MSSAKIKRMLGRSATGEAWQARIEHAMESRNLTGRDGFAISDGVKARSRAGKRGAAAGAAVFERDHPFVLNSHGLINLMPHWAKSPVLRVARLASASLATAAIMRSSGSACRPFDSRSAQTSP